MWVADSRWVLLSASKHTPPTLSANRWIRFPKFKYNGTALGLISLLRGSFPHGNGWFPFQFALNSDGRFTESIYVPLTACPVRPVLWAYKKQQEESATASLNSVLSLFAFGSYFRISPTNPKFIRCAPHSLDSTSLARSTKYSTYLKSLWM